MRLLVVEDDATMRRFLTLILQEEGYVVDATGLGEEGISLALGNDYDAIVVDLRLPDMDGVGAVKAIRRGGRRVPIIVFTGRTDRAQVIGALDAGADDYLTKPTDAELICARMRALVRRGQQGTLRDPGSEPLRVGNISLDSATRRIRVSDQALQLTPKELMVLEQLMIKAGQAVSRTQLLEKVWDMHFDPTSNVVDTHVSRLRSKLKKAGATALPTGVRGTGFIIEHPNGSTVDKGKRAG